jgi:hypothetical protein
LGVSADTDFVIRQTLPAEKDRMMQAALREMNLRALGYAADTVAEMNLFQAVGERRMGVAANQLEHFRKKLSAARVSQNLPLELHELLGWAGVADPLAASLTEEAEETLKNWKNGERPHFDPVKDYHLGASFFSYLLLGLSAVALAVIAWGVRLKFRFIRRERMLNQRVREGLPVHRKSTLADWRIAFDELVRAGGYANYESLRDLLDVFDFGKTKIRDGRFRAAFSH